MSLCPPSEHSLKALASSGLVTTTAGTRLVVTELCAAADTNSLLPYVEVRESSWIDGACQLVSLPSLTSVGYR